MMNKLFCFLFILMMSNAINGQNAIPNLDTMPERFEDFLLQLIETSVHFNRRLAGTASGILTSIVSEMDDSSSIEELIARFDFDKNELKRLDVLREKLGLRD